MRPARAPAIAAALVALVTVSSHPAPADPIVGEPAPAVPLTDSLKSSILDSVINPLSDIQQRLRSPLLTSPVDLPPTVCEQGAPTGKPGWLSCHAGTYDSGYVLPLKGKLNQHAQESEKLTQKMGGNPVEQHGTETSYFGLPFIRGDGTNFGGKHDAGLAKGETAALTQEPLAGIGDGISQKEAAKIPPENLVRQSVTNVTTVKDKDGTKRQQFTESNVYYRRDTDYFCAMRLDYKDDDGKAWWKNKKLLVFNPETGKVVVCRLSDWGPHGDVNAPTKDDPDGKNKIIDLSPASVAALTGNPRDGDLKNLQIAFAVDEAPLGPMDPEHKCRDYRLHLQLPNS